MIQKTLVFTVMLIVLACFTQSIQAQSSNKIAKEPTNYYVSVDGDDINSGTINSPFRTIAKATKVLRAGDTCFIYGGIYRELLKPQHDGLQNKPIVFRSIHGEKVSISAMDKLQDAVVKDDILDFKVDFDLKNENSVFCDGKPMILSRWPNKKNSNQMDIEGAIIKREGSSPSEIKSDEYPEWFSPDAIEGSTLWANAESKWSSWTSHVTGYNKSEKTVLLKAFGNNWWVNERHNPGRISHYGEGVFYLAGAKSFLDAPNEWYLDAEKKLLKLILPDGKSSAESVIEMKRRAWTADLSGCSNIEIIGVHFIGAPIRIEEGSYCIIKDCTIRDFYYAFGYNSTRSLGGNSGILLGGRNNSLNNCEIHGSAGSGVIVSGESNSIVNCNIYHIDMLGSHDAAALNISGKAHLISHNSIHDVGRDCMRMGGGRHIVQYNHIYNPGRISEDLGTMKWGGQDADNTIIHHNLIENDNDKFIGIYFDNYTNNVVAHHNIIKGVKDGIRSNRPGHFHIIYNNTASPDINNKYGPWEGPSDQFGCVIANNMYETPIMAKSEVLMAQNVQLKWRENNTLGDKLNDSEPTFPDFPSYLGAVEPNSSAFKTGHDFSSTKLPEYDFYNNAPFVRNHLRNGCFDFENTYSNADRNDNKKLAFRHWEKKKSQKATVQLFPGFNFPTNPEHRFSIHGYSLCLSGKKDDGVAQQIGTLAPSRTYILSGYVKMKSAQEVVFFVNQDNKTLARVSTKDIQFKENSNWKFISIEFRTSDSGGDVIVNIEKIGKGIAYIDDVGVVPNP